MPSRVQVLRRQLEDFRKRYKGNLPPGSMEAQYARNLEALVAAEGALGQP
jgi:hypothetical protein